jgi:DNA polymerase III subunit gamma/tau
MNLALKYRPREFNEVVGQKATSVILSAMISKNRLSQVLLFTGPSGVGKTTMARIIAAQLNSEGAQDVHQGTHPAVLEIDAASNGSVDAVRQLKRDLNYATAGHRVVIIDEVHAMSDAAFAALLNMLEFPPTNVTFVLITTESHKVPVTIRHRCDRYEFKKASVEDLAARLHWIAARENIVLDNDLIDLLAVRAEGSFREAVMLLEQVWVAEISSVEAYNELQGEVDYGPSLLRSAMDGPAAALNKLEGVLRYTNTEEITDRTVEVLKDIMILKGGTSLNYSGKALESRLELASKLGTVQVLKAIRIVWDLQTKLNAGDPVRGLELAYALIGEVLQINIPAPVAAPKKAPMSFEDMKRLQK